MRYIWLHIRAIIETYSGDLPLSHFLRHYFRQYPVLGSRDRKLLSAMAYSWYRSSKAVGTEDVETKIRQALLHCNNELPKALQSQDSEGSSSQEIPFDINRLFPFALAFSDGIREDEWLQSMLVQPHMFLRIVKDKGKVISLLNSRGIPITFVTDTCLSLPNSARADEVLPEDTYAVQDASSQETGSYFRPAKNESWYDCCAGAGGKALLLKSLEHSVRITVSDIRESVLYNLKKRFSIYHYHEPVAHTTDVADKEQLGKALGAKRFDHIICDAPCSGSGTWARTPEQLHFFDAAAIEKFSALQKQIAVNVSKYVKPGGRLIYITCSVFKNENEDVVAHVLHETGLQLTESRLINGISKGADSMYIAVLQAP